MTDISNWSTPRAVISNLRDFKQAKAATSYHIKGTTKISIELWIVKQKKLIFLPQGKSAYRT